MTEQNYAPNGDSTTHRGSAATSAAQPPSAADQRQPAKPLTRLEELQSLDYLWLNESITEHQRDWSTITPVLDERMSPQLGLGGYVVDYLLNPTEYQERLGKVVVVSTGNTYLIGRLSAINRQTLVLSYDNTAFPDTRIPRKAIRQVSECIWTFGSPVL